MSYDKGARVKACTYDHKPQFFSEQQRVWQNGGVLYRVSSNTESNQTEIYYANNHQEFMDIDKLEESAQNKNKIFGPWRVKPGGLSVSGPRCLRLTFRFREPLEILSPKGKTSADSRV